MLIDNTNSKIVPMQPPETFSKNTIYKTFIQYCKNKSLHLNEKVDEICRRIDTEDIETVIRDLEAAGVSYNEELFEQLMTIVNKKNTVTINFDILPPNKLDSFKLLLDEIITKNIFPKEFKDHLTNPESTGLLDTYEQYIGQLTSEHAKFNKYLQDQNRHLLKQLSDYNAEFEKTTPLNISFLNTIADLVNVKSSEQKHVIPDDERAFKMIEYMKNCIDMITTILPNIIINGVNYKNVSLPTHWNLSEIHYNDIRKSIDDYYKELKMFYGDRDINIILQNVMTTSRLIKRIAESTPFYNSYVSKDKEQSREYLFNDEILHHLYKYYLLQIVNVYKNITENENFDDDDADEDADVIHHAVDSDTDTDTDDEAVKTQQRTYKLLKDKDKKYRINSTIINLLNVMLTILTLNKEIVNNNYNTIMNEILKFKEAEKDAITDRLKAKTDDERKADNALKSHKLGDWGKGLRKGLYKYDKDTYDEERKEDEQQILLDQKVGIKETLLNAELITEEVVEGEAVEEEIEAEAYSLEDLVDDDDTGDPEAEADF